MGGGACAERVLCEANSEAAGGGQLARVAVEVGGPVLLTCPVGWEPTAAEPAASPPWRRGAGCGREDWPGGGEEGRGGVWPGLQGVWGGAVGEAGQEGGAALEKFLGIYRIM